MVKYSNKGGNSPITHFEIADDFIVVKFNDDKSYTYNYRGKAGKSHVDKMKSLAVAGSGLCTYINQNVKHYFD